MEEQNKPVTLTDEETLVLKRLAQASIVVKVVLIPCILTTAALIVAYSDIVTRIRGL